MKNAPKLLLTLSLLFASASLVAMEGTDLRKSADSVQSNDEQDNGSKHKGLNPDDKAPVEVKETLVSKAKAFIKDNAKAAKKAVKKAVKNNPKKSIAAAVVAGTVATTVTAYKTCPVVKKHVNKAAAFVSDNTKAGYNWTASKLEGKVTKAQAAVGVTAIAAVVAGVIFRNEIKSAAVTGFDKAKAFFKKEEAAQN